MHSTSVYSSAPQTAQAALRWSARTRGEAAVAGLTLIVGGTWFALAYVRHATFASHRFDLGNLTQTVANTASGHFLELTAASGEQIVRLGAHVEPILLVFVPLWKLWGSPLMLIAVQNFALAAGALPVFWLARKHLESELSGIAFAISYLLYLPVQYNALNDFHPVALAIPLLLYAVWFADEGRSLAFVSCSVAAAMTKEEIGLGVVFLGIWYARRRSRWRVGLSLACFAAVWTVVAVFVIIPHFSPIGHSPFYDRYAAVGGSPSGLARTVVDDPVVLLSEATSGRDIQYLLALLAPWVGAWLFAPLLLLGAAPDLALNLLSGFWSQVSIRYQYVSGVVPYVVAASVFGAARIRSRFRDPTPLILALSITTALLFGPQRAVESFVRDAAAPSARTSAAREALSLIPAGVPVSATNKLGAHLSERRRILLVPATDGVDWLVIDLGDPWLAVSGEKDDPSRFRAFVRTVEASAEWSLVFREDTIRVYRRHH